MEKGFDYTETEVFNPITHVINFLLFSVLVCFAGPFEQFIF